MSSTSLPPPTEEQLEGLRMFIGALMHSMPDSLMPYLAVLAEGLHIVYSLDGETLEPNGQWGLRADVFPVEEEVGDDD